MIGSLLSWYVVVQLVSLAALPLTLHYFRALPDRGYGYSKVLGILLVGFVLWLGTAYGILRNERGGAWLSWMLVAALNGVLAWRSGLWRGRDGWRNLVPWRAVVRVEILFVLVYVAWAIVRSYDPAANHTEQPMDLMLMNSIAASATYPPQDAWLAGYAISYYYFGYWLLTTLAHLSGEAISVAYTLGQSCWFGLLAIGVFTTVYNLVALRTGDRADEANATGGGILAVAGVALAGNLQVVLEWLHANGYNVERLARFFNVNEFPESARVTNLWYIGSDTWWWWRSSRVLQDRDLLGNHKEVIDEFPMFSYLLGDNHPHVLAMPVVLLAIGLAIALYARAAGGSDGDRADSGLTGHLRSLLPIIPLGWGGLLLCTICIGALFFINTWDFPPYWALLVVCVGASVLAAYGQRKSIGLLSAGTKALVAGGIVAGGTLLIFLPYLLTAQSQAGGFIPNLFYPTHLPQYLLMFGAFLPALVALFILGWQAGKPETGRLVTAFVVTYGLPALFLFVSLAASLGTSAGREMLAQMALPEGATSHLPFIAERWATRPWTFLFWGGALAVCVALIWERLVRLREHGVDRDPALTLVLLLAALGLLLVYTPEFVYLRDNFGTRMNTIFKFSYQAWLLFGLASAFVIARTLRMLSTGVTIPVALSVLSVLGIAGGLIYPVAGIVSKTNGFGSFYAPVRTLDAAAYIGWGNSHEMAAIEWVRENTAPGARVLEGKGASYQSNYNRISVTTGRPTLLGWDGHQSQWRGRAYGEMASGRPEALASIYRSASVEDLPALLERWEIDYVYVGPTERAQYEITPSVEERLALAMELVFESGDVRIYRRR